MDGAMQRDIEGFGRQPIVLKVMAGVVGTVVLSNLWGASTNYVNVNGVHSGHSSNTNHRESVVSTGLHEDPWKTLLIDRLFLLILFYIIFKGVPRVAVFGEEIDGHNAMPIEAEHQQQRQAEHFGQVEAGQPQFEQTGQAETANMNDLHDDQGEPGQNATGGDVQEQLNATGTTSVLDTDSTMTKKGLDVECTHPKKRVFQGAEENCKSTVAQVNAAIQTEVSRSTQANFSNGTRDKASQRRHFSTHSKGAKSSLQAKRKGGKHRPQPSEIKSKAEQLFDTHQDRIDYISQNHVQRVDDYDGFFSLPRNTPASRTVCNYGVLRRQYSNPGVSTSVNRTENGCPPGEHVKAPLNGTRSVLDTDSTLMKTQQKESLSDGVQENHEMTDHRVNTAVQREDVPLRENTRSTQISSSDFKAGKSSKGRHRPLYSTAHNSNLAAKKKQGNHSAQPSEQQLRDAHVQRTIFEYVQQQRCRRNPGLSASVNGANNSIPLVRWPINDIRCVRYPNNNPSARLMNSMSPSGYVMAHISFPASFSNSSQPPVSLPNNGNCSASLLDLPNPPTQLWNHPMHPPILPLYPSPCSKIHEQPSEGHVFPLQRTTGSSDKGERNYIDKDKGNNTDKDKGK